MRKILENTALFLDDQYHALVIAWSEDSGIYVAKIPNLREADFDADVLSKVVGTLVPDNHVHAPWREGITEVHQPVPLEMYIKVPRNLSRYNGTPFIAELGTAEIEVMEMLAKKPHPNVCTYYGCLRDGDLVGGICLQKYKCTLQDVIDHRIPTDQCPPSVDPEAIIAGIKAGLDHIHSFGLVHDDINPRNIMLDDGGNPVIIDFDSCVVFGAASCGGTPGWSKYPDIATIQNDMYGFELVAKFVRGEYDGQDIEMP